jgi:hypothetical protein
MLINKEKQEMINIKGFTSILYREVRGFFGTLMNENADEQLWRAVVEEYQKEV